MTSSIASPINSCVTGVPSLNWSGSITSYRHHLVITRPSQDGEGKVLQCESLQCRLRHNYLPGSQGPSGEAPREKTESPDLGLPIGEFDGHHDVPLSRIPVKAAGLHALISLTSSQF